jgi:hypothetical protein
MFRIVREKLRARIDAWRQEAARRRARTATDPGADALESCATDLEADVDAIDQDTATLTAEEFALAHGVTPQAVRRWCRLGYVRAEQRPNGWAIPRDAKPPLLRKAG